MGRECSTLSRKKNYYFIYPGSSYSLAAPDPLNAKLGYIILKVICPLKLSIHFLDLEFTELLCLLILISEKNGINSHSKKNISGQRSTRDAGFSSC